MTHVLEGQLRFVDRDGARAALRVQDGNAPGRRFVGQTVTLDLTGARISAADRNADGTITAADLLAGERVTVTLRLPRRPAEPPALLAVSRLAASHASPVA